MKKNLLVTLADKNYIKQAKHLFSNVYWNAGWKGDYMLLAHKIPEKELEWFKKKRILIKKCPPIFKETMGGPVKLSKFYLFIPEFKKWKKIVYLDSDMIVKASLDELIKVNRFVAVLDDLIVNKLIDQFIIPHKMGREVFNNLKKIYDIKTRVFKSGVMIFNTNIIKKDTFSKLIKLSKKYTKFTKPGSLDQPILNLLFYKKWEEIPIVYNLDVRDFKFINPNKITAIIFHFDGNDRPWIPKSHFHKEWNFDLNRANKINLDKIPDPSRKFKQSNIKNYSFYLKIRSIFYFPNWIHFIDRTFGLIGIFLYDHFPNLYFKLKKLK